MEKILKIANQTAIAFTVFILILSVIGFLLQNDIELNSGISTLFTIPQSIRYITIFQAILACFTLSVCTVTIEESKAFRKVMFLWKFVLTIIVSVFIMVIYIAMFDWFPIASIESWIAFFISFMLSMVVAISLMIYRTKKADKVYQDLFEEYKKNHKGE